MIKKALILNAAAILLLAGTSAARADIPASQPGDGKLTCTQLVEQIGEMDEAIAAAEGSRTKSKVAAAGFGILQSVTPHFGIGKGTIGAMQATGAAATVTGSAAQNAEQVIQQAQTRRTILSALHTGKECTNTYKPKKSKGEKTAAAGKKQKTPAAD